MGKRGHLPPSGNVVKCFCAVILTAKCSVNESFMHHFHKLSSTSGALPPGPQGGSIPAPPWGTFVSRSLICIYVRLAATSSSVPRHRCTQFGRRAFSVAGPMAWNALPAWQHQRYCSVNLLFQTISEDSFFSFY